MLSESIYIALSAASTFKQWVSVIGRHYECQRRHPRLCTAESRLRPVVKRTDASEVQRSQRPARNSWSLVNAWSIVKVAGSCPVGTFFDVSRNFGVTITIEYPAMKSRSKSHRCSTYGRLVRRDRYAKNFFGISKFSVTNGSAQICSEKLLSNSFVYGCGAQFPGGRWMGCSCA